jgi:hypothetical protein
VQAPAAASGERLAVGEWLFGRYRIERELGEGGMGVVYLATDEQVGETYAIKVLKVPRDLAFCARRSAGPKNSAIQISSMCIR